MKISIDASRYGFGFSTGVEWYSFHIINGILKNKGLFKGNDVCLYTNNPKFELEKSVLEFLKKNELNLEIKYIKGKRFWTLIHLSFEILKNKPDLLFVPSHTFPLILPKHSVIMIHDLVFKRYKEAYSFFQRFYLNWSTKFAVKHASKILVPSQTTKNDLHDFFNCPLKNIDIIYHGFSKMEISKQEYENDILNSPAIKHFNISNEKKYLFFIGRIETKKNILNMLKAFKDVHDKYPDFNFVLSGKRGFGFKSILKYCEDNDLMNCVYFTGYINESEKRYLYENSFLFVFTTLFEGFGLPILESFYYKKPVVSSNIGAQKEISSDAAFLVDPGNYNEIRDAILKLIEDTKLYNEFVEKGLKRLNSFDWEKASIDTLNTLMKYNAKH